VVGDPKQSIYRFRGADIAAYQSFVAHLLADKKTVSCELKTNFRSTAAVLAAVNAIFPRLMRHKPGSQPEYLAIAPREGLRDGGAAVEAVIVEAPDALTSQKTEAAWVSSWILRHCGEPGSERGRASGRLRFKDMAVLMRTSSALSSILDAFKAAGIPYVVEMEKLFYGAQEIIDLLNLLRVLDDPEDRVSMAGLLRSPLLGLRDADLGRLFQAGSWNFFDDPPHCLAAEERRRLGGVFVLLRRLRGRVGRIPLGEFVHAVIQETPLLEAAARAYHGQQSVSNLLKFARMASTAADERGMTLKEFIGVVACAMSESRAEGESPLADEHLDAVRILSIHKAKGLEFPVVFLTNLSGASGRAAADEAVLVDWQTGRAGLRLPQTGGGGA
ncbi:MAG TPA: hypothetical protein DEB40_06415, partial [Elusimicrobia bacterium]|nr:hypothetical protein [Elusimicrobiota bacterium]